MEPQEFAFIYQDLKVQLKEIPSLPLLLKSVEKTTKKLECLNLYSLADRREFDFQLFQQNTFDEIATLVNDVMTLKQKSQDSSVNMQQLMELQQRIQGIKQKKMQAFDKLSKIEQSVQQDIDNLIDESTFNAPVHLDNQIKEVEEDQEELPQDHIMTENHQEERIQQLKKEIDMLNTKIVKINRGKGRWFDGDHNDFLKLYNRCRGEAQKIVQEGVKVLGMKNIEIMDHLELYENYLQLQKEKKLATEEFKSIKMLQQETKSELATQNQMLKLQKEKQKSKIKEQEHLIKKMQVEEFRRKKAQEHQKLINQMSKERQNQKKGQRISVEKKKEIEQRNLKLIEEQKEKFKVRNNSKGIANSKEKSKPSSIFSHKQANNLKPKLPKPTFPLPQAKNTLK